MSVLPKKITIFNSDRSWSSSVGGIFHENTKFTPATVRKNSPRISEYLVNPRCVLEGLRNYKTHSTSKKIKLGPVDELDVPITALMHGRKTCRSFTGSKTTIKQVSNILGRSAAVTRIGRVEGFEDEELGMRPYPSGGGLYPCELYLIAINVDGINPGVYHYNGFKHELSSIKVDIDIHYVNQIFMANEATQGMSFIIVTTSVFERCVTKYQERGYRIALLEAGHVAQNLLISAECEKLGALSWGGFFDDLVSSFIGNDPIEEPPVHAIIFGQPQG